MSKQHPIIRISIACLILSLFITCQNVQVSFTQKPPQSCMPPILRRQCKNDLEERARLNAQPPQVHVISQSFYFWGIIPKKHYVNVNEYCPNKIKEIRQYSTFLDFLYEQLTLGIYTPRTLNLTCYN
ncbi:Bor family protein [Leptospira noguchii]|uniref:Bor family protein n=1 Tax=Leptospira noguchii TaxID=28182 RepID=UPI001F05EC47|nr:Bor family protein [Leptospira noguchii]MCH1912669.1 Bor family protein [Leptospira noguchii]MCH1916378.1 Bor family protein [Leptospira noguchii]UOG63724.1 Bor family protein [Leptospira noguchii]